LTRSRIVKALTDRGDGGVGYDAAETRLSKIRIAIVLGADQAGTAAGQAAFTPWASSDSNTRTEYRVFPVTHSGCPWSK